MHVVNSTLKKNKIKIRRWIQFTESIQYKICAFVKYSINIGTMQARLFIRNG